MKQGTLDESQGPGGSYSERCLEAGVTLEMGVFGHVVNDVKAAAKNNSGEILQDVGERRGKFDRRATVEARVKIVKSSKYTLINNRRWTEEQSVVQKWSLHTKKLIPRCLALLTPFQQLQLRALW